MVPKTKNYKGFCNASISEIISQNRKIIIKRILAITQKGDYDTKVGNEDNQKVKECEYRIAHLVYKFHNSKGVEIKILYGEAYDYVKT